MIIQDVVCLVFSGSCVLYFQQRRGAAALSWDVDTLWRQARFICERSRMRSCERHSPGTPLLRCFSNLPKVQVSILQSGRPQCSWQVLGCPCEPLWETWEKKTGGEEQYFNQTTAIPFVSETQGSRSGMVADVR